MTQPIDKEKFLSLVLEHKKIIFKVCHSYCKHAEDRKDLVQEILIQLWKSSGRYDTQYKLSTWIYRIAINVAISFYRSQNRRKQNTTYFDESILEVVEDDGTAPELESNIRLLYRFIDRLDSLNKALMLLYLDRYSYQEISDILGITETNVATKISRIKLKLKKQFSQIESA